jgi:hypothetical protein
LSYCRQIAVVAEQHLDAILQPGAGHALGSPAVLLRERVVVVTRQP